VFLAYVGMKEEARPGSRSIKYLELNPAQIRQDPVRCTQGPCDYPRALLYRSAVPSGTCSASRPKQAKSSQKYQLSDLRRLARCQTLGIYPPFINDHE
jgi:hypothetical protein